MSMSDSNVWPTALGAPASLRWKGSPKAVVRSTVKNPDQSGSNLLHPVNGSAVFEFSGEDFAAFESWYVTHLGHGVRGTIVPFPEAGTLMTFTSGYKMTTQDMIKFVVSAQVLIEVAP